MHQTCVRLRQINVINFYNRVGSTRNNTEHKITLTIAPPLLTVSQDSSENGIVQYLV